VGGAQLTSAILGAAINVHKLLGPGLLESAYEECLAREFTLRGMPFARQKQMPVVS
jgi:GxxExxY protein